MPQVVGVRFGQATKVYYFDPNGFDTLVGGDYVIVDTARGRELGKITSVPHNVPESEIVGKLKKRLATRHSLGYGSGRIVQPKTERSTRNL